MQNSFQTRMQYAIECVNGNQSELARRVSEIIGRKVTPQAIQKLAFGNPDNPATSSGLTVAIAKAAGLNPYWLALGTGEPHGPPQDLVARTMQKLQSGNVPEDLKNSLYSLMSAIAGTPDSPQAPHAATNIAPYHASDQQAAKKEAIG